MVRSVKILLGVTTVFVLSFALFALPPRASAKSTAGGLTLSPPLRDVTLGPGLIETSSDVTITNNTPEAVRAHLKLVDLKALGEFGGTSLDKAGLPDSYGLANWMRLPGGDTVVIPANQTVKVSVLITNRSDLRPGGHYGAVLVTTDSGDTVRSNVNINQQLVSLIFVKKLGGEKYGLDLKEVLADETRNRLPQVVKIKFASTGNVHVIPRGYVEVTDPKGKLVSKAILNPDSSLILPGASRQYTALLQPVSSSNVSGQYTITVHYRHDGKEDFETQSMYFTRTSIPYGLLAVFAGAVLVSGGLAAVAMRRKSRRHRSR